MSDKTVRVYDTSGVTYLMSPAEAEKAVGSGIYSTAPGGQARRTEVVRLVDIAQNTGKVAVFDAEGKEFLMHPVDAREAVKFGYTHAKSVQILSDKTSSDPAEKTTYKDRQGHYLPLDDIASVPKQFVVDALKEVGQQFRITATKTDLIKQWNAFVLVNDTKVM